MLYLYVDENYIKRQRNPIKLNGISYSNPTDETLRKMGYLPLVENEKPEHKEGCFIYPKYRLESDKIVNEWQYVEVEDDDLA